jgi:hypothetical protein
VLANVAILGAVAVGLVASLDFFLSDAQKDKASNQILRIWNRIDDTKRVFSGIWLRRDEFRGLISFLLLLIAIINVIYSFYKMASFEALVIAIQLQLLSLTVIGLIGIFTLAAPTLFKAAARLTAIMVPVMIAVALSTAFLLHTSQLVEGSSPYESDWVTIASLAAFSLALSVLGFWILIALPVITLLILSGILFAVEFIARRLAEYHKGPIIGASVLMAFIAGIYKAFH